MPDLPQAAIDAAFDALRSVQITDVYSVEVAPHDPDVRRKVARAALAAAAPHLAAAPAALEPAERMAVTVARAQLGRGENPPINMTAALLLTIDRLTEGAQP